MFFITKSVIHWIDTLIEITMITHDYSTYPQHLHSTHVHVQFYFRISQYFMGIYLYHSILMQNVQLSTLYRDEYLKRESRQRIFLKHILSLQTYFWIKDWLLWNPLFSLLKITSQIQEDKYKKLSTVHISYNITALKKKENLRYTLYLSPIFLIYKVSAGMLKGVPPESVTEEN